MPDSVQPILSICIPTFNRARFLEHQLSAIRSQCDSEVGQKIEVCISDNASTDDTLAVASRFRDAKYCKTVIASSPSNVGPIKNMRTAFLMGGARYVWFQSDDDEICKGAIGDILSTLRGPSPPDAMILNRFLASPEMVVQSEDSYLASDSDVLADWSDPGEFAAYVRKARTVDALGCFASSLVLSHQLRDDMFREVTPVFYDCWFPHAFALLQAASKGHRATRVLYVAEPKVIWRSGNSSCPAKEAEKCLSLVRAIDTLELKPELRNSTVELVLRHYRQRNQLALMRMIQNNVSARVAASLLLPTRGFRPKTPALCTFWSAKAAYKVVCGLNIPYQFCARSKIRSVPKTSWRAFKSLGRKVRNVLFSRGMPG